MLKFSNKITSTTYTCCSNFIPSFPTSWQLPNLENVGCESLALLTAISSTSLPKTSMGSKSITSNSVSSHAFATTVKENKLNTSVQLLSQWVCISSVQLTRICTVDGRKNGLEEALSKRRKVSHFVNILFLREHSQITKHLHDVFSLSQVEQKPFFFIATTTIPVALNEFKVRLLEGSDGTCR